MAEHSADKEAPDCACFWTDPKTWLSAASCGYGSGYEPGSQMEWNPDCQVHPPYLAEKGPLCECPPCPGRGLDGHGLEHCAECCFGTGVVADLACFLHGDPRVFAPAATDAP